MEERRISPPGVKAVAVSCDMVTAFGRGSDVCWDKIVAGSTAISQLTRFQAEAFMSQNAAALDTLRYHGDESLVMQMLRSLFEHAGGSVPRDAKLILATTKGEIDLLEQVILEGRGDVSESRPSVLLGKVAALAGIDDAGMVISAACASSSAAVARAAAMIRGEHADCVLAVACDSVTEFVFSGFSSLMALDKNAAMPFDKDRSGLSLGDAAAYVLIMSEARAKKEERTIIGEIAGWGLSDDANHMTGPSRDSQGMILALQRALKSASAEAADIGFISAHGTGTVYNDAMEIRAFEAVFRKLRAPVYSIKGAVGHTMGAAGLIEMIIAFRALNERKIPSTVNLHEPDANFREWVSVRPCNINAGRKALLTNAGFSGINAALILAGRPE
jgi:3-oxoacyl-[acyl-carrier-protein] synthase II